MVAWRSDPLLIAESLQLKSLDRRSGQGRANIRQGRMDQPEQDDKTKTISEGIASSHDGQKRHQHTRRAKKNQAWTQRTEDGGQ